MRAEVGTELFIPAASAIGDLLTLTFGTNHSGVQEIMAKMSSKNFLI